MNTSSSNPTLFFQTKLGNIYCGDSLDLMKRNIADSSIDLIITSPPFGLVRKKSYGNVNADQYVNWFRPFGFEFRRILKKTGSLVIDIGGAWNRGQPTRSLYHFELLIMAYHAMQGSRLPLGPGDILVEPFETADASRMGHRPQSTRQGCCQLRLVAGRI